MDNLTNDNLSTKDKIKKICRRISSLRKQKEIKSATIAANEMGIIPSTYQGYETDRLPTLESLIKIKNYYNTSFEYLLEGKNDLDRISLNQNTIKELEVLTKGIYNPNSDEDFNFYSYLILNTINKLITNNEGKDLILKIGKLIREKAKYNEQHNLYGEEWGYDKPMTSIPFTDTTEYKNMCFELYTQISKFIQSANNTDEIDGRLTFVERFFDNQ